MKRFCLILCLWVGLINNLSACNCDNVVKRPNKSSYTLIVEPTDLSSIAASGAIRQDQADASGEMQSAEANYKSGQLPVPATEQGNANMNKRVKSN
jgi:hypothetical protein